MHHTIHISHEGKTFERLKKEKKKNASFTFKSPLIISPPPVTFSTALINTITTRKPSVATRTFTFLHFTALFSRTKKKGWGIPHVFHVQRFSSEHEAGGARARVGLMSVTLPKMRSAFRKKKMYM